MSTDVRTLAQRVGIHEQARAAWRAQSERNEREAAERTTREQAWAIQALEQQVVDVLGADAVLTDVQYHQDADDCWIAEALIEGTPTMRGRYGLVMRFECRSCDLATVFSGDVSDLARLGHFLADREAGERYATTCASCWSEQRAGAREARAAAAVADGGLDLPPRCLEARVGDLIREIVRAELSR